MRVETQVKFNENFAIMHDYLEAVGTCTIDCQCLFKSVVNTSDSHDCQNLQQTVDRCYHKDVAMCTAGTRDIHRLLSVGTWSKIWSRRLKETCTAICMDLEKNMCCYLYALGTKYIMTEWIHTPASSVTCITANSGTTIRMDMYVL